MRVKEEYVTAPGVTVRCETETITGSGMWSLRGVRRGGTAGRPARSTARPQRSPRNALVSTRDVSELTKADLQIPVLRVPEGSRGGCQRNSDAASALANAQARSERLKDEIELLSASITRLAAEHAEQRDLRVAEESKARELKLELVEERDIRGRAERKAADLAAECEEHRCRAEEHRAAREADARRADEARTRCADVDSAARRLRPRFGSTSSAATSSSRESPRGSRRRRKRWRRNAPRRRRTRRRRRRGWSNETRRRRSEITSKEVGRRGGVRGRARR